MNNKLSMSNIRKINRQNIVFNIFKQYNHLSKFDIKKITNYSMSTVISTVDELLSIGYIKHDGIGESRGGRPPVYYTINESGGYLVGIDFNSEMIYVSLISLRGNIIKTICTQVQSEKNGLHSIIEQAIEITKKITSSPEIKDRLLAIGIAAPGIVDAENGTILYYALFPKWKNINVRDIFMQHFSCNVYVEKSINAIAYDLLNKRAGSNTDNLILISIRSGVGMSCILNGSLYRGFSGAAGEIGHIRVHPSITLCQCGKTGCLDSEASIYAIAKKMDILLMDDPSYQSIKDSSPSKKVEFFVKMIKEQNTKCLCLLDELCYYLATVSAMLVNIFNPHEIVFFGELTNCGNYFLDRIKRQISKDSFSMSSEHLSISVSDLPPRAASEGAAHYALEKFFVPIDIAKMALSKQNSIK